MSNHNTYAVIELTEIDKIDFTQVGESSVFTIRKSLDDTQFIIKWLEGYIPTFISNGSVVPLSEMNHETALELMGTAAWSEPMPVE